MLFKSYLRPIAVLSVCTVLGGSLGASAQNSMQMVANPAIQAAAAQQAINAPKAEIKPLLASAACPSCGATLDPVLLMASSSKAKDENLLTDSLWGNLILEMAYQRDKELQRMAKKMNVLSMGTLAAIGVIAAGTLAQGIDALYVLNPAAGHEDSYVPGAIGVGMSSATILTFLARFYFSHKFQKQVKERQIAIKTKVEALLAHLEHCDAKCADAKKQLSELIGDRACNEWVQLWQSSHQLAMAYPRRISNLNKILETR